MLPSERALPISSRAAFMRPLRRGSDFSTSQTQAPPSYAVFFIVATPTAGVQLAGVVPATGAGGTGLPSLSRSSRR